MAEGELPKYGLENKTVFYRSRFEVKPRYGIEAEVWPQIVRTLQLWLEEKEERRHDSGQPNLLTALTSNIQNFASIVPNLQVDCYLNTLFACGNIKEETNLSRIEVKAYFANEGDHIPKHWAMEYL